MSTNNDEEITLSKKEMEEIEEILNDPVTYSFEEVEYFLSMKRELEEV